ncbi:MAG TPA: DUF4337 domain-containing protein [Candidatus Acidoferrales bacterium]|jgi:hypothetical protein|nr:DUF4337 domain-containing protein [Candidatus Acidoferrales bacterium]
MPGGIEVETKELQEQIHELHEEHKAEQKKAGWIRYVGLSTALLAVVAAMSALQSSNMVNEALIHQIKASDMFAEFQSSRMKEHLYTLTASGILDRNPGIAAHLGTPPPKNVSAKVVVAPTAAPLVSKTALDRVREYQDKIAEEQSKEKARSTLATNFADQSEEELGHHHYFEIAVALIQVAIALGAISALAAIKPVWYVSMLVGAIGIVLFAMGFR